MSKKLRIYVVRHGKTLMNTLDKVQGWCDSPLTDEGIEAARYLGYGLSDINFRTVYCSDLRRTRQTSQIILGAKGQEDIPIVEMEGLRETCFGSFEAGFNHIMWNSAALYLHYVSMDDMVKDILSKKISYKEVLNAVKEIDKLNMAESFTDVEARTQESLKEIARKEIEIGEGNILVVSHGMSILAMLLGLGGDKYFEKPLENAAVCEVTYEEGEFTVHSMADLSYVDKGRELASKM